MAPVLREIYHLAVVGVAAAAALALYLAAIPIGEKRHLHLATQLRTSMKAVIALGPSFPVEWELEQRKKIDAEWKKIGFDGMPRP